MCLIFIIDPIALASSNLYALVPQRSLTSSRFMMLVDIVADMARIMADIKADIMTDD